MDFLSSLTSPGCLLPKAQVLAAIDPRAGDCQPVGPQVKSAGWWRGSSFRFPCWQHEELLPFWTVWGWHFCPGVAPLSSLPAAHCSALRNTVLTETPGISPSSGWRAELGDRNSL